MKSLKINGILELIDFSLTHRILLFRKFSVKNDLPYNMDIMFVGSFYTEIPLKLNSPIIYIGNLNDLEYMRSKCEGIIIDLENCYIIESKGVKYYIGARSISIEKNNFFPGKNSLRDT